MIFMPGDPAAQAAAREIVEAAVRRQGLPLLGWRDVPVDAVGARATRPPPPSR